MCLGLLKPGQADFPVPMQTSNITPSGTAHQASLAQLLCSPGTAVTFGSWSLSGNARGLQSCLPLWSQASPLGGIWLAGSRS